jgi:branched-chain amino acid transport system ATP-binding protein
MSLLAVEELDSRHGLLQAVRGVSLSLEEGQTLALVGANGAGKTTLLRTIAGAHRPAAGRVLLRGSDITDVPAHRRVAMGISLVPEGRRLFPGLTVEENLRVGAVRGRSGRWDVDAVLSAFPMLEKLRGKRAASLSGGEQQATAIGRALMANPDLLLLDEVSLGLSPAARDDVYGSLADAACKGATAILVEQDLDRVLGFADRVVCMLEGRIVLDEPADPSARERITEAYFGLRAPVQGNA